jgi:hypothetical protein
MWKNWGLVEGEGKGEGKEEEERRFVLKGRGSRRRAHTRSPGEA